MKIGLLMADELRPGLAPKFGDYPSMFKRLLDGHGFCYAEYDARAEQLPARADECDGYLISGSRHGVYDDLPWLPPLFECIRRIERARVPLLGICFGHQAVAAALGGRVEKFLGGWELGVCEWRMTGTAPWLTPARDTLRLQAVHQDQALALPAAATPLAGSDFCQYAAFAIGQHVFCLQGHPEFGAAYAAELLEYRKDDTPAQVLEKARGSLYDPVDSALCAQWIARFFKGSKE